MFIIPNQQTKKHLQDNKSDLTGTIYQSRNISLDEQGYIKLAEATYAQFTGDDDADFDASDAIYPMNNDIYLNSDEVFNGNAGVDPLYNRSGDTGAPTPGVEEDVIYFNGTEVVSDGAKIYYKSGVSTWTAVSVSGSPFSTSVPTCLTTFASGLAVGNNNCVKFINTSWAVNGTVLTLPNEYQVSSMVSIGNNLYIATRSKSGGNGQLFVIDSIKATYDYAYPTGTFEIFSIKPFKSTFVGINSLGELLRFNGGGFDVIATLPVYKTNIEWADALNDYSTVANRALSTDGDLIYINLISETENGVLGALPDFPAGVWCYDDSNGSLYHKFAASYSRRRTLTSYTFDASTDTFTLTSGNLNDVVTGMPVFFEDGGTSIPELKDGGVAYYIIKLTSTTFQLAESYTNALAGTKIALSGSKGVSDSFHIIRTNDYGWTRYASSRAAMAVLNNLLFQDKYCGRICMTAELSSKQDIATTRTVFSPVSPYLPNRGYFITPKLNSASITDNHNLFTIKFKPLKEDDKIIVKYKSKDKLGYPKSSIRYQQSADWKADWTSTSTFTTVSDLSDASVGDEIEIIGGVGSGHLAHITAISESAGTYTVTLGEAFPFAVSGDEFWFNIDNWTYLTTIDSTNTDNYYMKQIGSIGKFIQFKIEMRGIGVTVEEVQIDNNYKLPATR